LPFDPGEDLNLLDLSAQFGLSARSFITLDFNCILPEPRGQNIEIGIAVGHSASPSWKTNKIYCWTTRL